MTEEFKENEKPDFLILEWPDGGNVKVPLSQQFWDKILKTAQQKYGDTSHKSISETVNDIIMAEAEKIISANEFKDRN